MKTLVLALTTAAALGLTGLTTDASAHPVGARPVVKVVKIVTPRGVVKKVVVRRGHHVHRHVHRAWPYRHRGVSRTVIVKRPNGVVVRKRVFPRG